MTPPNDISRFLDQVHRDWQTTQALFPNNTHPPSQWPIPFFGNPATALVATIGVNPSSGEFDSERRWESVKTKTRMTIPLFLPSFFVRSMREEATANNF